MNEEQRAVLTAIHRMEGNPGTLIDEYTVARAAGLLPGDLTGNEYLHDPGRERIRQIFDNLDQDGLIRLDREGYWRPRTTLSGRRVLQHPPTAAPSPRPSSAPAAAVADAGAQLPPAEYAPGEVAARPNQGGWPSWWPLVLRVGEPRLVLILAPALAVVALLAVCLLGSRLLGVTGGTPTPTTVAITSPVPSAAAQAQPTATPAAQAGNAGAAQTATAPRIVPTVPPTVGAPTPTAGPAAKKVMIVNTDNQGARLYVTPAGERRIAVPEGFILEVIGPDERDTKGQNWKHVRYLDFEGWIPEEFTTPAQ